MPAVRCPRCHKPVSLDFRALALPARCPGCAAQFRPTTGQAVLEPPPVRRPGRATPDAADELPPPQPPDLARGGLRGAAAVGAAVLAVLGLLSSQYAPVFASVWERHLAPPWGPVRVGLIPVHLFAFTLAGALLGGLAGAALASLRRDRSME